MRRYPSNPVVPHGWYSIIKGNEPMMWLDAYDESIRFDLMGGLAIPDRHAAPECVRIPRNGLTGLIPPWEHIDQKGATEEGVTQVDALYGPTEVGLKLTCRGRDAKHTQRVARDVIASIDAIAQSKLNFITHDLGHWWAPVRWFKGAPPDPVTIGTTQTLSLRLRADDAFWRTYDHVATFGFDYESMVEEFDTPNSENLGENWPLYFHEEWPPETGGGHPYIEKGEARWFEEGTNQQGVVCGPYKGFETATTSQVIEIRLGSLPEITFNGGAFNDIWGRMGRDENGDWDGNGIRARIGIQGIGGYVELTRFNSFVPTMMAWRPMIIQPWRGERYTLVCGVDDDLRFFRILRNGISVLSHKESGTNSELGEDFRGVGFGMLADNGPFSQAKPAYVSRVTAGDNAAVTQSGFLECLNVGDQPMYYDFTLFGPFDKVKIYDGPESDEFVEFGPLVRNQIVFLRTDPRVHTSLVEDLTTVPPTPQQLNSFQQAIVGFLSFAGMNGSALGDQIRSTFGIRRPQGNLYRYLNGRFSSNVAIPPKSPGNPAEPYFIKVEIVGGDADSRIIASATPLRRSPI